MDDSYLDDFISLNEKGYRQRDEWATERVAQVVNWSERNVVAKERLSRVDLEMILDWGLLQRASSSTRWKTHHINGMVLIEQAMQKARKVVADPNTSTHHSCK